MNQEKLTLFISNLLIAAVVLVLLTLYLSRNFDGFEFDRTFLTQDLGLTIDALSISPFSIDMNYQFKRDYLLNTKDSKLEVKRFSIDFAEKYNFISEVEDSSLESNQTIIKKESKKITIK